APSRSQLRPRARARARSRCAASTRMLKTSSGVRSLDAVKAWFPYELAAGTQCVHIIQKAGQTDDVQKPNVAAPILVASHACWRHGPYPASSAWTARFTFPIRSAMRPTRTQVFVEGDRRAAAW